MLSVILLSAGLSQRFGSPKALALHHNTTTIIKQQQQLLLNAGLTNIIIVLGHDAEIIQPHIISHPAIRAVFNPNYQLGQTTSFQAGLQNINPNAQAFMLLPVDYAFISLPIIENLILIFQQTNPKILIPTFNHRKGHPPIFHISLKSEFLALSAEQPLNSIAQQHSSEILLYPTSAEGVVSSFNNTAELAALKQKFNL